MDISPVPGGAAEPGDAETVTMWRSDRRELAIINQNT